ncbi:MAG: CvpA family protein, partial [Bacteroidota bacterium]
MNYLDYITIVIILIGFLLGFKDGLVRKVIGLLGLIFGIGLAFQFSGSVGKLLIRFFNNDEYLSSVIAGILIFFVVIIIATIIKRIVHPFDKVNRLI